MSLIIPVLNLSTKNSRLPILKASPGYKLYDSWSKSILYSPQDFDASKFKFLRTIVPLT